MRGDPLLGNLDMEHVVHALATASTTLQRTSLLPPSLNFVSSNDVYACRHGTAIRVPNSLIGAPAIVAANQRLPVTNTGLDTLTRRDLRTLSWPIPSQLTATLPYSNNPSRLGELCARTSLHPSRSQRRASS